MNSRAAVCSLLVVMAVCGCGFIGFAQAELSGDLFFLNSCRQVNGGHKEYAEIDYQTLDCVNGLLKNEMIWSIVLSDADRGHINQLVSDLKPVRRATDKPVDVPFSVAAGMCLRSDHCLPSLKKRSGLVSQCRKFEKKVSGLTKYLEKTSVQLDGLEILYEQVAKNNRPFDLAMGFYKICKRLN